MAYSCVRQFRILRARTRPTFPFRKTEEVDWNYIVDGFECRIMNGPCVPGVLLEERPPDGLSGVGGEDELDGLVLERIEDLLLGLSELDEALERLLDVGLGGGNALLGDVAALDLVLADVGELHLLREVGQVEHVGEGARHDDGVVGRQLGEPGPDLAQLRGVAVALVLRRHLVAFLDLQAESCSRGPVRWSLGPAGRGRCGGSNH